LEYRVDIATAALNDATVYYDFILHQSHDALPADNWFNGLRAAVDSLETFPKRCPHIPEQENFKVPLRQLIYASHRIIFRIDPKVVRVVRIYHTASRPLKNLYQRAAPKNLPQT